MSGQKHDTFIIDSNVLITPYKFYYSFEIAPQFWDKIAHQIRQKNIVILDKVFDEIAPKKDPLSDWIKNIQGLEPLSYKNTEVISNYGKIINHIQACGFYSPAALNDWSQGSKAPKPGQEGPHRGPRLPRKRNLPNTP